MPLPVDIKYNLVFTTKWTPPKDFEKWTSERRRAYSQTTNFKKRFGRESKGTMSNHWVWLGTYKLKGKEYMPVHNDQSVVRIIWKAELGHLYKTSRLRVVSAPTKAGTWDRICPRSDVNPYNYIPGLKGGSRAKRKWLSESHEGLQAKPLDKDDLGEIKNVITGLLPKLRDDEGYLVGDGEQPDMSALEYLDLDLINHMVAKTAGIDNEKLVKRAYEELKAQLVISSKPLL